MMTQAEVLARATAALDQHASTKVDAVDIENFWSARKSLRQIQAFARARRVGPWALFGSVIVRLVANIPPNVVIPAIIGGPASLNLFIGIVSTSGGGKGSAEAAAVDAIMVPEVTTMGPGSGEGIAHLFAHRNRQGNIETHATQVILSAAEVETMAALKGRQASTLFPELRKAWTGEPLGFAYVDPTKRLTVGRHKYRLCLLVGIQPEKAGVILDDADAGTPQRFLWLPANDPDAPDQAPIQPVAIKDPRPTASLAPNRLHPFQVCQVAVEEIVSARVEQLRGNTGTDLDGHALLGQLKVAAALALLDCRHEEITEEDWRLAKTVRAVSDNTRQNVIDSLAKVQARRNHQRAEAEAQRAIVVDHRKIEDATQRVGRFVMAKLNGIWISHSELRGALPGRDRGHFEDAITRLIESGLVEQRETQTTRRDRQGTEYRKRQ